MGEGYAAAAVLHPDGMPTQTAHVCLEFRDLDLSYVLIWLAEGPRPDLVPLGLCEISPRRKGQLEGRKDTGRGGRYMPSPPSHEPRKLTEEVSSLDLRLLTCGAEDTLAERLRRRPAKPMGSPRVGSNPTGVVSCPSCACYASWTLTETNQSRMLCLTQQLTPRRSGQCGRPPD